MKRWTSPTRALLSFICLFFLSFFHDEPAQAFVDLRNFQTNAVWVSQSGGGDFSSGEAAWTPYVWFGRVGLRGQLGAALLKNGFGTFYPALNAEGLVSFSLLEVIGLEGGGGLHYWVGNGGSKPGLTGNFLVLASLGPIDRFFAGYTRLFDAADVGILRVGLGLSF